MDSKLRWELPIVGIEMTVIFGITQYRNQDWDYLRIFKDMRLLLCWELSSIRIEISALLGICPVQESSLR